MLSRVSGKFVGLRKSGASVICGDIRPEGTIQSWSSWQPWAWPIGNHMTELPYLAHGPLAEAFAELTKDFAFL